MPDKHGVYSARPATDHKVHGTKTCDAINLLVTFVRGTVEYGGEGRQELEEACATMEDFAVNIYVYILGDD